METKKPEPSQGQARYDASVPHRNLRRPEPVRAVLEGVAVQEDIMGDDPALGAGKDEPVEPAGAGVKAQAVAGQARTLFCHGILPGCGK